MTVEVDLTRAGDLARLSVPAWVQGVWQRTLIRTQSGVQRVPFVLWVQTPTLFADIRAFTPDHTAVPGAREEGFSGSLEVEDQVCRWHRPIDLHPGPEDSDQGAMFLVGDTLIEVGLHANYLEEYQRIEQPGQCFAASRGGFSVQDGTVRFAPEGALEIVVAVGRHVIHARRDGTSRVRYGRWDEAASTVAFTIEVGPDDGARGKAPWTVWTDDAGRRNALLTAAEGT